MADLTLNVVTVSTRPGRKGPIIADWFVKAAGEHGGFDVAPVDLAEVALPLFDEPEHPARQTYHHEHTKRWSAITAKADAFVFVTPEYNYMPPASFFNAVDYLHREWHYKPVGFVSYGGVSGGMRAAQGAKQLVPTMKMMPIPEGVVIPVFTNHIKDDVFEPNELHKVSATAMLDELAKWATALKPLRQPA
ncbi:NADPH-dependent FMN reductase [Mangrovicella endophytica]|uniref:NADPH-dependent FMN reductase n=1 Tax=Mangrovicella endophytica TaxID=2066697 RepID=UPI000C9DC94C|nr:NAD(P)H-dependent oxidoreductase [Mangrovicella endophytica]